MNQTIVVHVGSSVEAATRVNLSRTLTGLMRLLKQPLQFSAVLSQKSEKTPRRLELFAINDESVIEEALTQLYSIIEPQRLAHKDEELYLHAQIRISAPPRTEPILVRTGQVKIGVDASFKTKYVPITKKAMLEYSANQAPGQDFYTYLHVTDITDVETVLGSKHLISCNKRTLKDLDYHLNEVAACFQKTINESKRPLILHILMTTTFEMR